MHEGGFQIRTDVADGFTFHRPDGLPIPDVPSVRGAGEEIKGMHAADIRPTTATPTWNGDRLDLAYAVSVLTQTRRDASAEALSPSWGHRWSGSTHRTVSGDSTPSMSRFTTTAS